MPDTRQTRSTLETDRDISGRWSGCCGLVCLARCLAKACFVYWSPLVCVATNLLFPFVPDNVPNIAVAPLQEMPFILLPTA